MSCARPGEPGQVATGKLAKQEGAPSGAAAKISYFGSRTQGEYRGDGKYQFRVDETFRQGFDLACEPVEIDNWVP